MSAEDCFPRSEVGFVNKIVAFDLEVGVLREADTEEEIARCATPYPSLATAGEPKFLAIGDAWRNAHLELFGLVDAARATAGGADTAVAFACAAAVVAGDAALDRDGAGGAFHGFFKGDHEVAFDVFAALGEVVACGTWTETARPPA